MANQPNTGAAPTRTMSEFLAKVRRLDETKPQMVAPERPAYARRPKPSFKAKPAAPAESSETESSDVGEAKETE